MPRLLLVDDNPSIHKIAESLLAASDVQLTCVDSASEALALIERGEGFDVALLDTSMLGMDGWALLDRLRAMEATARMPIAMMAGVLEMVDPARLDSAPIQGFLRKPVELRDLGDRVHRLLETPVPPPPAPEAPSPFLTQPGLRVGEHPEWFEKPEEDLLVLGPEDLLTDAPGEALPEVPGGAAPEDAGPEAEAALLDEPLDLEELDLESLRSLTPEEPEPVQAPVAADIPDLAAGDAPALEELPPPEPRRESAPADLEPVEDLADLESAEDLEPAEDLAGLEPAENLMELDAAEAPTLEEVPFPGFPEQVPEFAPEDALPETEGFGLTVPAVPQGLAAVPSEPRWSEAEEVPLVSPEDSSDPLDLLEPPPQAPDPEGEDLDPEVLAEVMVPQAEAPGPVAPPAPEAAVPAESAAAALLENPEFMDRLTRAVVARLGEETLRSLAWEVMPDLADRLSRK